jgi:hypothetical protein
VAAHHLSSVADGGEMMSDGTTLIILAAAGARGLLRGPVAVLLVSQQDLMNIPHFGDKISDLAQKHKPAGENRGLEILTRGQGLEMSSIRR